MFYLYQKKKSKGSSFFVEAAWNINFNVSEGKRL